MLDLATAAINTATEANQHAVTIQPAIVKLTDSRVSERNTNRFSDLAYDSLGDGDSKKNNTTNVSISKSTPPKTITVTSGGEQDFYNNKSVRETHLHKGRGRWICIPD